MSERLRQAYKKQWQDDHEEKLRLKNKKHLKRMELAGYRFILRHPDMYSAGKVAEAKRLAVWLDD